MAIMKSKKAIWIIASIVLIGGGIGAYFLLRKPKKDGEDETPAEEEVVDDKVIGGIGDTKFQIPKELDSEDKIKAFQDWMDAQGKPWVLSSGKYVMLNKGAGYGNYGKSTNAVWKVFGKDYLAKKGSVDTPIPSKETKDKSSSADVKSILKYAKGVTEAGLNSLSKTQAKNWADAIKGGKTIYFFNDKVYSTIYGEKILNYNPLKFKHYTTKDGLFYKETSQLDSKGFNSSIGRDLGKVGSIVHRLDSKGNGVTLFWMPDAKLWIFATATSTTNPTSSFSGVKYEPFSNMIGESFDLSI
jgi:hypothetical protein